MCEGRGDQEQTRRGGPQGGEAIAKKGTIEVPAKSASQVRLILALCKRRRQRSRVKAALSALLRLLHDGVMGPACEWCKDCLGGCWVLSWDRRLETT
jgi:hypothetical protein